MTSSRFCVYGFTRCTIGLPICVVVSSVLLERTQIRTTRLGSKGISAARLYGKRTRAKAHVGKVRRVCNVYAFELYCMPLGSCRVFVVIIIIGSNTYNNYVYYAYRYNRRQTSVIRSVHIILL